MNRKAPFGGRWEVVSRIGGGGQGDVFVVTDLKTPGGPPAVLKRLLNHKRLDRFEREIAAHNALDHPGIPRVIDSSTDEPAYFVTPESRGKTLDRLAPMAPLAALALFQDLCEIVDYAHSSKVIHRDLKPENVLRRDDGSVAVLDFGLCFLEEEEGRLTETMEQVGSRYFIPPELEAGRSDTISTASDVYPLGKILYFLLTGKRVARENVHGDNDIVSVLANPQLGYVRDRIIARAVEVDPARRASVRDLIAETKTVRRLIEESYYPGREGSRCRFCGEGDYVRIEDARVRIKRPRVDSEILFEVVACSNCSNVQWFFPSGFSWRS